MDNPQKLKVIASANGDTQVKNLTGNDLNSKSTSVSFEFNEKNDVVNVGDRDEYFACAYALNHTNQMQSYSCDADELNLPEGTECEHRGTSHTGHIHNLVARWKRAFSTTGDSLRIQNIFLIYAMWNTISQGLSRHSSQYNNDLQE